MPTSFGANLSNVSIRGQRGELSGLTGSVSRGRLGRDRVIVKEPTGGSALNGLDLHKDASALHALAATGVAPKLHGYEHGSGPFGTGRHYVAEDVSATMDGMGTMDRLREFDSSAHTNALGNLAHSAFAALGAMHGAGIAHGDLQNKPEHVFMDINMMGAPDHADKVRSGNYGVKFIDYGNAVHRDDPSFPRTEGSPRTFAGTTQMDIKGLAGTLLRAAGSVQNGQGQWIHPQNAGDLHKTLEFINTKMKNGNASDIANTILNINAKRNASAGSSVMSSPSSDVSSIVPNFSSILRGGISPSGKQRLG